MFLSKLKMEFIGTMLIVYFSGLLMVEVSKTTITEFECAIGMFLVYSLIIWVGKGISGAQFNPALSLVMIVSKHNKLTNGLIFVGVQIIASLFGISLVSLTYPNFTMKLFTRNYLGYPKLATHPGLVILSEMLIAFFYVLTYYMLVLERNAPKYVYGAGIGAVVAASQITFMKSTACGLNFARVFGYMLFGKDLGTFYPYLIGNLVGALLGSIFGILFLSDKSMRRRQRRLEKSRRVAKNR